MFQRRHGTAFEARGQPENSQANLRWALRRFRIRLLNIVVLLCGSILASSLLWADSPQSSLQTISQKSSAKARAKNSSKRSSRKKSRGKHARGQANIDSGRAHEIQTALIREHYLNGQPSGIWDDATQKAMKRYQADQGWQSKTTPDARALIKLGLGPDQEHLLNPESAMTSQPISPRSIPISTSAVSSGNIQSK